MWRNAGAIIFFCIFGALLPSLLAAQSAPAFSEQEFQAIEGAGIPRSSGMVVDLTAQELVRIKQIITDQPTAEVKAFLVTRYFIRKVEASKDLPELTMAEQAMVQEDFDWEYCNDFKEQMLAFNALLFLGITPARGATPP
jgi:hypothetical protein